MGFNIVDELVSMGARVFIKIGTFVSLNDKILLGDVLIPDSAQNLPGTLDAILPFGEMPRASDRLVEHIRQTATRIGTEGVKHGVIPKHEDRVLTNPVYGPFIRNDVKHSKFGMDYWTETCFGKEWECSALFAAAPFPKADSAAILVCNRRRDVLHRGGPKTWHEHKDQEGYKDRYQTPYDGAVKLALDALTDF